MEQLSDVQLNYAQLLNASLSISSEARATDATVQDSVLGKHVGYQQLMRRIREVVGSSLPNESTVLVVSKGDEELLKLDGRQAWHFPQTEEGTYAGHHPANADEAIGHLEVLRAKGADYLLFPNTAFWWLEHYKDFRQYLDSRYGRLWDDEHCLIYGLSQGREEGEVGVA
jgi:hypothetical protein